MQQHQIMSNCWLTWTDTEIDLHLLKIKFVVLDSGTLMDFIHPTSGLINENFEYMTTTGIWYNTTIVPVVILPDFVWPVLAVSLNYRGWGESKQMIFNICNCGSYRNPDYFASRRIFRFENVCFSCPVVSIVISDLLRLPERNKWGNGNVSFSIVYTLPILK